MPFQLHKKYIEETEIQLEIKFPTTFKQKMLTKNGGAIIFEDEVWRLYPFFDKTNNKTAGRTCNHIGLETKNARKWIGFPQQAIAIGENGGGDKVIMLPDTKDTSMLSDGIHIWLHETGEIQKMADKIIDLPESD
jgi:hypothetical protein